MLICRPALLTLGAIVMVISAGRVDNTYLPPSNTPNDSGNDYLLSAPKLDADLPTGVESDSAAGSVNYNDNPNAGAGILKFESGQDGNGSYKFEYETKNEIRHSEVGELKNAGEENEATMSVEGSYSYMGPDGVMYTVRYIADENGFRATGDHIPTTPLVLEPIQETLDKFSGMEVSNGHNTKSTEDYVDIPDVGSAVHENGHSYHNGNNQDSQAVVIDAEPQFQAPQSANHEYLLPKQVNVNVPFKGYRY